MKALIIDDEPMPAKDLAYMIQKHCYEITSVKICNSVQDAIDGIKMNHFDLIFLDIEMPEMSGFDFLTHAKLPNETKIIITTAYEQYAVKAFDVNAVHYLLKPVTEAALVKGVRKVIRTIQMDTSPQIENEVISIFDENEHNIIALEDIIRIEASGNYTTFHLLDKKLLSSKSIGYYEDKLSSRLFFRPHRSHLINLKNVQKLSKGKAGVIVLSNGDTVPLTQNKREAFAKVLGL